MLYTIQNSYLSISADTFGAELHSLKCGELEYLWQCGDAWKRYAPILFPFICAPADKKYLMNGKEYQMKANHGFARDMEFTFLRQTENELAFELTENAETLAQYPFHFRLEIIYRLSQDGVEVCHIVENTGNQPMYFYLGGHPAFQCPIGNDGEFSDYYVEYEQPEHLTHQNGMEVKELREGRILPVSRKLFDYDSIILPSPASHKISLKSEKSSHSVTLEFPESDCITVWSTTGNDRAAFVCLEPWTSVPTDFDNAEPELSRKKHAISLDAGQRFSYSYKICVK